MQPLGRIGVLGVPYDTGSKRLQLSSGAKVLRQAGVVTALKNVASVVDFGDLTVDLPPVDQSNPTLLNPGQIESLCSVLSAKVKGIVAEGCFPFIIGGECSQMLGIVEGLQQKRLGVVYMDAHGDFNIPETTPSGTVGGMCLAIAAGHGAKRLTSMFGHEPLVAEENIVLFGVRSLDELEAKALGSSKIKVYSRPRIRDLGVDKVALEIVDYLMPKCDGIYLHIDLDVLDESVFSAQSLAVPDGISKREFQTILKALSRSGKLVCLALVSFDAQKDADGTQADKLTLMTVEALS